jgi:RHS repeat-associated protein
MLRSNEGVTDTRWHGLAKAIFAIGLWLAAFGAASASVVTYYLTDPQGTPLVTTDSSGNVLAAVDYNPYGRAVLGQRGSLGFTGHVEDVDTGLTYMQQRYFDPEIGAFLSVDQVGVVQGGYRHFARYAYGYGNPYRYTDPDGRCPTCLLGALIGGGMEIALQYATKGKVDSWTAVAVSAGVGAITGGASAFAAKAAISGATTATRAVTAVALTGGAANGAGKITESAITGEATSSKEVAVSVAAGIAGSGIGGKIATATTAKLEAMVAQNTLSGTVGRTTQAAIQQGGPVRESAAPATQKIAEMTSDAASSYAEKRANEKP